MRTRVKLIQKLILDVCSHLLPGWQSLEAEGEIKKWELHERFLLKSASTACLALTQYIIERSYITFGPIF